jgi:phosphate transport system permease protein
MTQLLERPLNATPWKSRKRKNVVVIAFASIFPSVAAFVIATLFDIPGAIAVLVVFLPIQLVSSSLAALLLRGKRGVADAILNVGVIFSTFTISILLGSVLFSVISWGLKALSPHFLYQNSVYVSPATSLEYGGVGHAILGSLIVVGLVTLVTVPLGIGVAVYLTETNGRFRDPVRFFSQAMSGLPSVVAGLFIYTVFISTGLVKPVGWLGAAALLLLMLPTIARMSEEVLKLVPGDLRSAALALGAPRRRAFFLVILPAAKTGLITAVLLGLARVFGETAPLILTTNISNETNVNPASDGMTTLPTYIYSFLSAGYDTSRQRAWGAALVLLIIIGFLFTLTRIFGSKTVGTK